MSQENNDNVCILLAVWGEKFINDFLQLSLPSLLASGNIPALTKTFKTRFKFLTCSNDHAVFEKNQVFQNLKSICDIEFTSINDLIVVGNYSTTLTLAFDRAIKETGKDMLNTYFVFLTSDYIMANGSMEGLIRYIKQGYSGICAGNFQVIEEELQPFLLDKIDSATRVMEISPRELLKESFKHLHPIVVASQYQQNFVHNYRANRFFYRYSEKTMAGRFYLLHMLCIKPEIMNYEIGSSCDYSFIPAMCPSGNIGIINDSDDYLVVEIQSKNHELNYIVGGEYDFNKLALSLSEWTTEQHRKNAKHSIYFHVDDLKEQDKQKIEKNLNNFVNEMSVRLKDYPEQPHNGHPYWIGAIEAFNYYNLKIKEREYDYFEFSLLGRKRKVTWFYRLFGMPPQVYPWHYRFYEYNSMLKLIQSFVMNHASKNVAVFYDTYQFDFTKYCGWFKRKLKITHHYHVHNLLANAVKLKEVQENQFELIILMARLDDLEKIDIALKTVRSMIHENGQVLVIIPNERNSYSYMIYDFQSEFLNKLNYIINSSFHIDDVKTVHDNLTLIGRATIERINRIFDYSKKSRFLAYILFGIPGIIFCTLRNLIAKISKRKKGHCTNIIVKLTPLKEVEQKT